MLAPVVCYGLPMTTKQLRQKLLTRLVTITALVASFGAVTTLAPINTSTAAPETPAQVAPAEGSPEDLIQRHKCWTGEAPADMTGVIPGHVVVTKPGAMAPTYGAEPLVAKALGQLFDGQDHGLTVHAFCR